MCTCTEAKFFAEFFTLTFLKHFSKKTQTSSAYNDAIKTKTSQKEATE